MILYSLWSTTTTSGAWSYSSSHRHPRLWLVIPLYDFNDPSPASSIPSSIALSPSTFSTTSLLPLPQQQPLLQLLLLLSYYFYQAAQYAVQYFYILLLVYVVILLLVILSFDKLDSYLPPQHLHLSPTISTTTTPTTFTCFACDSTTTSASSSTRDYDFHQYQRLLPPVLPATIIPFIPYSDPSSVIKENRKRRERKRFSDQTIISTTTTIIREYRQWICFDISYPFSMTISSFKHENLPMHVDLLPNTAWLRFGAGTPSKMS